MDVESSTRISECDCVGDSAFGEVTEVNEVIHRGGQVHYDWVLLRRHYDGDTLSRKTM